MYTDPADMLRDALEKRDITQKQFADMLGIHQQSVSRVLTGKSGLSYKEWGRWFGALGLKIMWGTQPLGASMGFFVNPEDAWDWLLKHAARGSKGKPKRLPSEFYDVLERAGLVTQENWPKVLPLHLQPIIKSGWLWREGNDTAEGLAAAVRSLL